MRKADEYGAFLLRLVKYKFGKSDDRNLQNEQVPRQQNFH